MTLNSRIEKVLSDTRYDLNPYFVSLRDGTFVKEDFIETQIQFYNAVIFFSRPMSALAGKIPEPEMRLEILRNIWEEHGEGELSIAHGRTFLEFLNRLGGVKPEQVLLAALWPEVRIFNTGLAGIAVLDDFLAGVAALGIIERMFSDISAWIGRGIVARGWMTDENMIHYKLHAKIDIKHSDDFFDILREGFERSDENRYHIEQGLRFGATLFNDMYAGLYRSRGLRWYLPKYIPPSRTADSVP